MKESDVSDMALKALAVLQNELVSASGNVERELSLIASIIDQERMLSVCGERITYLDRDSA